LWARFRVGVRVRVRVRVRVSCLIVPGAVAAPPLAALVGHLARQSVLDGLRPRLVTKLG